MKISLKFSMLMGLIAVLILGIATIASAAPKVTLTVLNVPNQYGDIVVVSGNNVDVDLYVYDPLGETGNQDVIRLIRISDGAVASEQRRGNALTGSRSLATQRTLVNPVLGEMQVQYVSSATNQVLAKSSKNVLIVDNEGMVQLNNRITATENAVDTLSDLLASHTAGADARFNALEARVAALEGGSSSAPISLLAYYPLDGNVLDDSGNAYDGSVGGTEAYDTGYSGQAFSFNGSTFISTMLDIDVSVQPKLTMGAWVYPVGSFSGQVLTHDDQGFDRSLLYSSDFLNPPAFVAYDGRDGGSVWFTVPANTGWQFVAVVYDQGQETVTLYVDGATATRAGQVLGPSTNMFRMGNNESNGWEFFNGLVDEVFVVSGALSADQLDQIRVNGIRSMFP